MANRYTLTQQQKNIDLYLRGCVNLYGYVTPRQFLKIYNKYNRPKILKEDLLRWANKLNRQSDVYYIYSNAIVNIRVPDKKIDEIIYYQKDKKYYTPTADEVVAYANDYYYEKTEYTEDLYKFLTTKMNISLIIANELIRNLEWLSRTEESMHAINDLFESQGIFIVDFPQAEVLLKKIQDMHNNTRKWANCGYTAKNMYSLLYL